MKSGIQIKQCKNCSHCIENKYYYYTHDNRMVECHLYTCGKDERQLEQREDCLKWEGDKEILG
nr:hypothetical protein [uncultured Niameybacter sp.]